MEPEILPVVDQGQYTILSLRASYVRMIVETPQIPAAKLSHAAVVLYTVVIPPAARYLVCGTRYFRHSSPLQLERKKLKINCAHMCNVLRDSTSHVYLCNNPQNC